MTLRLLTCSQFKGSLSFIVHDTAGSYRYNDDRTSITSVFLMCRASVPPQYRYCITSWKQETHVIHSRHTRTNTPREFMKVEAWLTWKMWYFTLLISMHVFSPQGLFARRVLNLEKGRKKREITGKLSVLTFDKTLNNAEVKHEPWYSHFTIMAEF